MMIIIMMGNIEIKVIFCFNRTRIPHTVILTLLHSERPKLCGVERPKTLWSFGRSECSRVKEVKLRKVSLLH